MITIVDAGDERIAAYRDIKERDLVGRQGLFIAEGEVVLRRLVSSQEVEPVSVLVADARAQRLAPLLTAASARAPVFLAPQAVLDGIVGFPLHRGVLAVGRRRRGRTLMELVAGAADGGLLMVLVGLANHDNIGGLFRNAAAFGVTGVILDETCGDPFYRKAIRVSVGAILTTPFVRGGSATDILDALAETGVTVITLSPWGETLLQDVDPSGAVAVVFGAEGPGLAAEVIARGQAVRVAMEGDFDSLNVATTSGIVLHHLFSRAGRGVRLKKKGGASPP